MKRVSACVLMGALLVFCLGVASFANVPPLMNYQGKLTDETGAPVPDGDYSIQFRIYDASTAGGLLWEEEQVVSVADGLFKVVLGDSVSIPDTVFTGPTRWLTLQLSPQPEFTPRTPIVAVAYAFYDGDWLISDGDVYRSDGNVGIGTTDPESKLHIFTTVETALITLEDLTSRSVGLRMKNVMGDWSILSPTNAPEAFGLQFRAGESTRMIIHSNGNVGIGTTSPDEALHVSGHIKMVDGNEGTGKVLTSDATGAGTWQAPAADYWILSSSVLHPSGDYGLSMRESNVLHGSGASTHVNFGVACTTGNQYSDGLHCTISGGEYNAAESTFATVGGGYSNRAVYAATVGGGARNAATGYNATVGGGNADTASGEYSTVGGGYSNTASGWCSFAVGYASNAPQSNSAAFNGQTSTAAGQTRIGVLSKASGTFTIDHPTEPMSKILNHYFVESPEMVLIYRGVATIGSDGRAEVHLPDYFDALNRNPMVQLTGVGTCDVYVLEKVTGNRFVIGGKPRTEVYWTVTGDRKDQSAEITRILMPVEQPKEGDLVGHSLDDDFLASTKAKLEEMGEADGFEFRTSAGQEKYEKSLRALGESR